MIDTLEQFLDSMSGSAWPFLVGGVICLVNSVNERDPILLNSWTFFTKWTNFLEGLPEFYLRGWGKRQVCDALRCPVIKGCHEISKELANLFCNIVMLGLTFAIMGHEQGIPSKCVSLAHADYVPALCTHRPSLLPIRMMPNVRIAPTHSSNA
ncbi:hypothetical protein PCE1_002892 [Barthelona sp. PCE]